MTGRRKTVLLLPSRLLIRWVQKCKAFDSLQRLFRTPMPSARGSESAEGPTASLFVTSPIREKLHPQPHALQTSVADQSIFQTA
jgi:hypothetical protein